MKRPEEFIANPPLHDLIGLKVEEQTDSTARVTIPLSDIIRGAAAPAHGGVLAALGDVACAAAIGQTFDPAVEIPVSTELHVRFYGQPKESPLIAEAELVHRGSRIIGAECVIRDAAGRQVARVSGTYMIVPGFGKLAKPPTG